MHYYNTIYEKKAKAKPYILPSVGFFRFLHAVPDAPNVDIYSYARLISKNIPFGEYIGYFPLTAEPHQFSIYPTGTDDRPALTQTVTLTTDEILTLAAIGRLNNIEFLEIPESNQATDNTTAMVRFAHLAPNAPSVDITMSDGTILFGNVPFRQVTPSIPVDPSTGTLQVRLMGTPAVVLSVPNLTLEPNKSYTLYVLGLVGEAPGLEAIIVEEPPLQSLISLEGMEGNNGNINLPNNGNGTLPNNGNGTLPNNGNGTLPNNGNGTLPNNGNGTLPNNGNSTLPNNGNGTLPNNGNGTLPNNGNGTLPNNGGGNGGISSNRKSVALPLFSSLYIK
ncbi:DUF4397 domain-containing protein [Clostridium aminobutyricum]|uniref:DUF4397 domain-containing protein n=1 Tax=Clostridium aminobutyricum TaxID=33953 RepID=A0A939DAC7_CLOAM|nr:DUF4397 domain-containing protein [Clostridium aminobutyricum]MBN7774334.1 DUF4397 domain-containing protein [Clostridium aminobutyricum]